MGGTLDLRKFLAYIINYNTVEYKKESTLSETAKKKMRDWKTTSSG
jgi:hypothetical protein